MSIYLHLSDSVMAQNQPIFAVNCNYVSGMLTEFTRALNWSMWRFHNLFETKT